MDYAPLVFVFLRPLRPLLLASLIAHAGACASAGTLTDPPLELTVRVTHVDARQRSLIEKHICSFEGVSACAFTINDPNAAPPAEAPLAKGAKGAEPKAKTKSKSKSKSKSKTNAKKEDGAAGEQPTDAIIVPNIDEPDPELKKVTGVLRFKFTGRVDELRFHISQLPHPGLTPLLARAELGFEGFDNTAPTVSVVVPKNGEVFTQNTVEFQVAVPDYDIKSVLVNETQASFAETGNYHATLTLDDGNHTVAVSALDESGNQTNRSVSIIVDTTPPVVTVKVTKVSDVKVNIRGTSGDATKLTLDGKPLKRGDTFQTLVTIDPDKTTAELIATDAHGNATTLTVPLVDGTEIPKP